jgi:hypothetical protein
MSHVTNSCVIRSANVVILGILFVCLYRSESLQNSGIYNEVTEGCPMGGGDRGAEGLPLHRLLTVPSIQ